MPLATAWSAKMSASSICGICHGRSGWDLERAVFIATSHKTRILQRGMRLARGLNSVGDFAGLLAHMPQVRGLLGGRLLGTSLRLDGVSLPLLFQPFGWRAGAVVGTAEGLVPFHIDVQRRIERRRRPDELNHPLEGGG